MPKAKRQSTATTPDPTRRISRLHLGRENEREWKRLRRALELSDGFALYLVSTAGVDVQDEVLRRVQASLPHRPLVVIDVQKAQRPVLPWLFKQTAGLPHGAVVTVRGLSRGDKALEPDFWNRFNERRNVWHMHNPQVHVWFVDGRIRRRIREDAPDLYSIRSPDFRRRPRSCTGGRRRCTKRYGTTWAWPTPLDPRGTWPAAWGGWRRPRSCTR